SVKEQAVSPPAGTMLGQRGGWQREPAWQDSMGTSKRRRSARGLCLQGLEVARPEGFEPPTNGFGSHYSIRLSYERVLVPSRHRRPRGGNAAPRWALQTGILSIFDEQISPWGRSVVAAGREGGARTHLLPVPQASVGEAQHQRAYLLGRDTGLLLQRTQAIGRQRLPAEVGCIRRGDDVQGAILQQFHAQHGSAVLTKFDPGIGADADLLLQARRGGGAARYLVQRQAVAQVVH